MAIQTNWYVITGGPCSGKTKTKEYLAFLGYHTVPETARILIDNEMSKGRTMEEIRANDGEFQRAIFQMKIDVENKIPVDKIIFFDRGIPDSIPFYKMCVPPLDITPVIEASQKRRYKKIFLLEQLPYEKDYARIDSEERANKLSQLIYGSYSSLGYEIVFVSVKPIDKRIEYILSRL